MLVFLKKVSMHADVNMMTSANLGKLPLTHASNTHHSPYSPLPVFTCFIHTGIIFGPSFVQPKMVTMEKMMCPKPVEVVGQLIELGSIPAK
jgi:hypothetical protein